MHLIATQVQLLSLAVFLLCRSTYSQRSPAIESKPSPANSGPTLNNQVPVASAFKGFVPNPRPQAVPTSPQMTSDNEQKFGQSRWDKDEASEVSSDSDWANELITKARQRRDAEQEYRMNEPQKNYKDSKNSRILPRVLPPAMSCRSESGDQGQRPMTDWRLGSTSRLHRHRSWLIYIKID